MGTERGTARPGRTGEPRQDRARRMLLAAAAALVFIGGGGRSTEVSAPGPSGPAASAPGGAILVDPSADTLLVGDSQQLLLKDGKGRRLTGPPISWTSFNPDIATVSPTGVVMGHAPGTARIVATSDGKSGTAVIAVWPTKKDTAECNAPRPGWIWCDDFEQDRLRSYFEYDNTDGAFVRVRGAGRDGSYGMRAQFARGQVSAGALHLAMGKVPGRYFRTVDAGTAIYREVYWRMYVRNPARWVGGA